MRRKLPDLLAGIVAAVVVFAAVPSVLAGLVGLPLPAHWQRSTVLSSGGLFDLLAVIAWCAWLACCWPLLRSVVARVRRRDDVVAPTHRLTEWLAARIAIAVLTLLPIGATVETAAALTAARPAAAVHATTKGLATPPTSLVRTTSLAVGSDRTSPPAPPTCTVAPGDSLWSLAEQYYGNGADWTLIAAANVGRLMDDGRRFLDPSVILVGWVLELPALSMPPVPVPAVPAPAVPVPAVPVPAVPIPTAPPPAVPSDGSTGGASTGEQLAVHAAGHLAELSARRAGSLARRRAGGLPGGQAPDPAPARVPAPVPLPELAALGTGVLAAGVVARRARRARHLASMERREGETPAVGTPVAMDTSTLLAPFDETPSVEWFETANRLLGSGEACNARPGHGSRIHLVRVGPDGVEVHWGDPVGEARSPGATRNPAPPGGAPAPWIPKISGLGESWLLPASCDLRALRVEAGQHEPWAPVSLPLGSNGKGSWLVTIGPGSVLALVGPMARDLLAAMRATIAGWSWSSGVAVTDDVDQAERAVMFGGGGEADESTAEVLFVGDPMSLSSSARSHCAVVTPSFWSDADLTVMVDDRAATVHPHGITFRPDLLAPDRAEAVAEIVSTPVGTVGTAIEEEEEEVGNGLVDRAAPVARIGSPRDPACRSVIDPGPVEVRLLTPTPRIEGLAEPLTPKRARRATELVAYLAMHHPDPATGDLLRTRVLGSADADAARKTLMNIAATARRCMGMDLSGLPRFPRASRTGFYRLSPEVTADAVRAVGLVEEGRCAADPEEAIALLRAALDLVEGEPLLNALTGYGWWTGEAFERRTAAALADGACLLARLAGEGGYFQLARWGIDQARLLNPYSEVLTRAGMRLAADTGDIDGLRQEWADCRRRADELDPGSMPSEATERLYAQLLRVPVASTALGR